MITRREFMRRGAVMSAAFGGLSPVGGFNSCLLPGDIRGKIPSHFRLASFFEENPNAVFIKRTNVSEKTDKEGMEKSGKEIAAQFFRTSDEGWKAGTHVVIKPNLVGTVPAKGEPPERTQGIVTNPYFLGGFIEGMRMFGPSEYTVLERSAKRRAFKVRDFIKVSRQKKFELISYDRPNYKYYGENELNWHTVENGHVLKHIPTLRPTLDKDSMLIYMPTFKAHNLGILTLSCKGVQGMIPRGYGEFCCRLAGLAKKEPEQFEHFNDMTKIRKFILSEMKRHTEEGYFRWDSDESMDELWVHYTLETLSAVKPDLCIIEGIVGRDGNAFNIGRDYLYNVIIAGLSPLYVDMTAHYLGGHYPWNVGLFRIAREKGLIPTVLPKNIDLYELTDKGAVLIENIEDWAGKYPLACAHHSNKDGTLSDRKNFVFLNDPITDDILKGEKFSRSFNFRINHEEVPGSHVGFAYEIEKAGDVDITIFNTSGRRVGSMHIPLQSSGKHTAGWNGYDTFGNRVSPGMYAAQLHANGKRYVQKFMVS